MALDENACTVCMICVRECPDWCIYIEGHAEQEETAGAAAGRRARSTLVLDRFAIDFGLCMYCGICVEACPFDALFWSPEYRYDQPDLVELTQERERLGDWMPSVPGPDEPASVAEITGDPTSG
jgi:NADH-quinone oxidoreductase subunit I